MKDIKIYKDNFNADVYSKFADWCNANGYMIKETESFYYCEQVIITHEEQLNILRANRETVCFSVINRGRLWYDTLSQEQIEELNIWYKAWLDVTITMVEPQKPIWLN